MKKLNAWIFPEEKNQKLGLGPTKIPLNFESSLDHRLDTNTITQIFPFRYYYVPCFFEIMQKVLVGSSLKKLEYGS